jgi:signal transduction histidine kinase
MDSLNHPNALEGTEESKPTVKILMVEDDEDDFILIRDLLTDIERTNFTIDWVQHYEEAIRGLCQQDYDVCLLDFRLGQHNGLEILEAIGIHDRRVPIIFLTGKGRYDVDVMAMKAGADDYLVKGEINSALLERSIRYAIDRGKSRRELEVAYKEMEQKVIDRTAELAEANSRLRKSSEEIKHFAYSVSHDLKSPVIAIYGLTRRLLKNYSDSLDEKGKRDCDQVLRASEQIKALVENINVFIATKEMPVTFEDLNLKEICHSIREEFSTRLIMRSIKWLEPVDAPTIRADRLSLLRAMRNLVENALKYGGESMSRIMIQYENTEKQHVISVNDDGIGLKEEDTKKIFGIFFREKTSATIEGTGLGLAIVKEIAERHKGEVWAESVQNKGVTISMSISKAL